VQNVLRAHGSPESQEPMVGVGKRPPTADGDEAGVAIFREDHFLFLPRELSNRSSANEVSRTRTVRLLAGWSRSVATRMAKPP
jgi:hypothetical protein